jgi:hypothetical protein
MNSGLSRRLAHRSLGEGGRPCEGGSLTKADMIAGISPYDGKSVNYSLFTYRQFFVDMVELSA